METAMAVFADLRAVAVRLVPERSNMFAYRRKINNDGAKHTVAANTAEIQPTAYGRITIARAPKPALFIKVGKI